MVAELVQCLKRVANVRKLNVNLRKGVAAGIGQGGRIAKSTWSNLQMASRFYRCSLFMNVISGISELAKVFD